MECTGCIDRDDSDDVPVGLDNRWLVTLNCDEAKDYLLKHGLTLFNKKIKLRRYDDVLNDEYMEFLQYDQLQKSLYAQKQRLATVNGDVDPDTVDLTDREICCEELDDDHRGLSVSDRHRGPPSTAVNTPEPL